MKYDGSLNVAIGMSAKSKIWKNKKYLWSKLVERLSEEHKTTETFKEYLAATKAEQFKIKDVGGYVGGYLRNGRRKPENIVHRQVMTLDIDFAHGDFWDDFCLQFDNAAVLHGTHKWSEESPRYRLIMPLSREATPDEYVAVSRQIAGFLGIDLFDNTTFETNRLMFWPSSPKDVDYFFESQEGPWVDVDEILANYIDWKDSSLWPTATKQFEEIKDVATKQEDPETKKGIIGAFCRTYSINEVMEKHLEDVYSKTDGDRYTYNKGTTAGGLIVYDDKFTYSHHGTDPCGGKLCNAFDLVRIHKFGHLDADAQNSNKQSKSFKAMETLARDDKEVKKVIAAESMSDAKYDFAEDFELTDEEIDWMQELEVDTRGRYISSATNINLIFSNDIRLKGLFKHNDFDGKRYVFGNMPWRKIAGVELIKNVDYSGVRNYIESLYEISGTLKIDDSMALEFEKNRFHPIREYLESIKWDKTPRIDTLLTDYLGADQSIYTAEAMRKFMIGAVGRIFVPGIKFDLVLTLVGPQGCGKSTLFKKLGGPWFSDTFLTVNGKEALEQIQGAWVIEIAELSGLRKAEVEATKHFISKQEDSFRPAYARASETYKRQCVFGATTNRKDFLKDPTGNRRFIPIDLKPVLAKKNIFTDLDQETIDQLWAEAVHLFRNGEPLFMTKQAESLAKEEQAKHSEIDERKGLIEQFLDTPILKAKVWDKKDIYERRAYYDDPLSEEGKEERDVICVAEVWCECLGKEKENMDRYKTREINDILKSLQGWEQGKSTKRFKLYGTQKYYCRKLD